MWAALEVAYFFNVRNVDMLCSFVSMKTQNKSGIGALDVKDNIAFKSKGFKSKIKRRGRDVNRFDR
jgi:hypothetical protein